jgi:SAM-dependent methyltransferase
LTVLRMDGTRLEFPSDSFDIVFSFSSIEHFGGANHSGALKSLKEMERVLKPGGIAIVATEYIINNKDPPDVTNQFYNERTIYSHLIDRLDIMKLIEPVDLKISPKTLETGIIDASDAVHWDTSRVDDDFKRVNPYIVIKLGNMLVTSIMLVFQK